MTRDETITVLAGMVAAWPNMEIHDATIDVWCRAMSDVDPAPAQEAFDRLILSDAWPPTVARFREVVRAVERSQPTPIGLPAPRPPIEETRAALAAARESLRRGTR